MRRSLALILWYSRLAALLPGTMIRYPSRSPNTLSGVSNRKLPWRLPSSGPWQAKQASERMGRTRSEERRVGKEWRYRLAPAGVKKKGRTQEEITRAADEGTCARVLVPAGLPATW